ncbi:MAG: hypothetical protein GDA46_05635 [Bdellovibrionales bacterium]|nr:hypothetical protein [Bdellovibrionales bacterium]
MAASVIGLIVMLGVATTFKNLNQQVESLGNENKQEILFMRIHSLMRKKRVCDATFNNDESIKEKIFDNESFTFYKLENSDIDFKDKNFLKKYNLKHPSLSYMEMECTHACNQDEKTWTLIVYTQDKDEFITAREMGIRLDSEGNCIGR